MESKALLTWSDLLRYPASERAAKLPTWVDDLLVANEDNRSFLEPLLEYAETHSRGDLEELFVRTFENNKARPLELGWHLYGENYARGSFMARMRGILRDLEIPETVELPDHLSHLLMVLSKAEIELARALARGVVLPALEKIEAGFKDKQNPYYSVITGLSARLAEYYGAEQEVGCHE